MALPGLQTVAHDPPRPLPDGRFELARKVLARGDKAAPGPANRREKLRASQPVHAEAVFVIFSKALRLENAVGMRGREFLQGLAFEARADAAGRNEAAHRLARAQVLHLVWDRRIEGLKLPFDEEFLMVIDFLNNPSSRTSARFIGSGGGRAHGVRACEVASSPKPLAPWWSVDTR